MGFRSGRAPPLATSGGGRGRLLLGVVCGHPIGFGWLNVFFFKKKKEKKNCKQLVLKICNLPHSRFGVVKNLSGLTVKPDGVPELNFFTTFGGTL
jgi:hypothetical protein